VLSLQEFRICHLKVVYVEESIESESKLSARDPPLREAPLSGVCTVQTREHAGQSTSQDEGILCFQLQLRLNIISSGKTIGKFSTELAL